jgi:hypothetical protein
MHALVGDSSESVFIVDQQVPAGHTWILRHISVTTDYLGQVGWRVTIIGASIPPLYPEIEVPVTGGLAGSQLMSSEWEGRVVVPSGYVLRFQNMAQLWTDSGTGQALISGYDLVD